MLNNNNNNNNNNYNDCEKDENESIKNIERILRAFEQNNSITICNIECSPGSQLGDNYMSVVKRVKVFGNYNNNEGNYKYIRY